MMSGEGGTLKLVETRWNSLKLIVSAILFNAHLGIKIKFGIENIFIFYGFDSDTFVQLIHCFFDDDEPNDNKYFLILFTSKYSVICNFSLWML